MVEGEPDRRPIGVRPLHPVAAVRRDEDPVPGAERARFRLVLETKASAAGKQDHPLLVRLVVPLARGSGVARGDDSLEPEMTTFEQRLERLLRPRRGQLAEEISHTRRLSRLGHGGERVCGTAAIARLIL
jgi:hypothetical protein